MSAWTHHGNCSTSDPCKRCFEFGETTERQRIIALLEAEGALDSCFIGNDIYLPSLIALIKGETE